MRMLLIIIARKLRKNQSGIESCTFMDAWVELVPTLEDVVMLTHIFVQWFNYYENRNGRRRTKNDLLVLVKIAWKVASPHIKGQ